MAETNKNSQSTINQQPVARVAKVAKVASVEKEKINPQTISDDTAAKPEGADLFAAVYASQKAEAALKEDTEKENPEIEKQSKTEDISLDGSNDKEKKFNIAFIVLIVVTVILFVASCAYLIYGIFKEDEIVTEPVVKTTNTVSAQISSPFNIEHVYSDDYPEGMQEKYKQLYDQNSDIVGWVTVPGTSIDMPVYQRSNNSYYLKTDNYGVYNKYGSAFLDKNCGVSELSRNTVVYAHNFDNGLIFDELHNYADPEFFKENPVIEYNTIYGNYKWKVIAAFYTNGDASGDNGYLFYYIAANMGDNSFMEFYDEIQQRSLIHTGVDVVATDKILTLSTCTYFFDKNGSLQNARFAVVARLVREGESEAVDTSLVTENENVRYPQLYYNVYGGTNPYSNAAKWEANNY